jgi:hypothetical protein
MRPVEKHEFRQADEIWKVLEDRGSVAFSDPGGAADAEANPAGYVERLLGRKPFRVLLSHVKPKDVATNWTESNLIASLHTDLNSYLPAPVQILSCKRPAEKGGVTLFADLWSLLEGIQARDPKLFEDLLRTPRVIGSHRGPMFSYRLGNFCCAYANDGKDVNEIDQRLKPYVLDLPYQYAQLQAGDVVINNNHRMVHGRTSFEDRNRHLIRCLAWFDEPLSAPREWIEESRRIHEELAQRISMEPKWIQERLGVFDLADLKRLLDHDEYDRSPEVDSPELENVFRAAFRKAYGIKEEPVGGEMPPGCGSG